MNNKYDTKGMATLVEKLDKDSYLQQIALQNIEPIDKLKFSPEDELKHLDFFYDDRDDEANIEKECNEVADFIEKIFNAK